MVSSHACELPIKRGLIWLENRSYCDPRSTEFTDPTPICDHLKKIKYSRVLPYALTEHGALMLASVLNSPRAVELSLFVVRAFIRLREMLASHKELARKLEELEKHVRGHDGHIQTLFEAIRQLMAPDPSKNRKIGFRSQI